MVDLRHVKTFSRIVPLDELRKMVRLKDMVLLQKGSRLSVQPVSAKEWKAINEIVD